MTVRLRRIELRSFNAYDVNVGTIYVSPRPVRGNYMTVRKAKKRLKTKGVVIITKEKIWEDVYV